MGIKFLADMGISLRTVSWLREQGYDVVHLRDEGLQTLPDEEILAKLKRGAIVSVTDRIFRIRLLPI